jgi:aspartate/methionine/tyrosine aminotransferase
MEALAFRPLRLDPPRAPCDVGEPMPSSGPRLSSAATAVRTSVFAALQARIDAYRAGGGELIPLQIGDTWLPPPEAALAAADAREIAIYGGVPGLPELRGALAERLRTGGLEVARGPENVHVGCGATHALFCAVRATLDPGDEVLVPTPYWPLIPGVLTTAAAVPVEIPLRQELYRDPALDVGAALAAACTPRTRAVYVTTPNNPDGHVLTLRQLEAIAALCRARDLWVFADEVYRDFLYDGEHLSIANLPGMAERTVTCHSLSKSHALAGARVGYVAGPAEVIDATRRISNHTVYNVPVPMQRAALRALAAGDAWIREARDRYRAARDATCKALERRGIPHHVPSGASFVFLDFAHIGDVQHLLELCIDRGVLLAPGDAFGRAHGAQARLCFTGVPEADVLRGIERLCAALDALEAEKR